MHHDAPPFLKGRGENVNMKKYFTADIILERSSNLVH